MLQSASKGVDPSKAIDASKAHDEGGPAPANRPAHLSLPLRTRVAAAVGGGIGALSRATGRGSGSVVGGHAVLAIEPRALETLSAGRQVSLVSGTNGKTTTTKLLASALSAGDPGKVVTNLLGANLPTGLAAALAGGPAQVPAVLEVDEAWLAKVAAQARPSLMLLLNLSRDQLDRNNEVRQVAQRWRHACEDLSPEAVVVANADDPLVTWAAAAAPRVTWIGAGLRWKGDAGGCPQCGDRVLFGPEAETPGSSPSPSVSVEEPAGPGHGYPGQARPGQPGPGPGYSGQGDPAQSHPGQGYPGQPGPRPGPAEGEWKCASCGFSRPPLDFWLAGDAGQSTAVLASGESFDLELALPGRCNQANALMALAGALCVGIDGQAAVRAMATVREVAGRYATIEVGEVRARLLLAKNPAGWAEVFDMLRPTPAPVVVAINARTADGHDPSWLWDVPFELLRGRHVVATGERALDLAVRLHYGEVAHSREADLLSAVRSSAVRSPADRSPADRSSADRSSGDRLPSVRPAGGADADVDVDVVANYTAFHQLLARVAEASGRKSPL